MAHPTGRSSVLQSSIGLIPPAVEDAQVDGAVGERLHAAGAAGFVRPQRRVEPDVHALNQVARDAYVVIFQEHHAPAELRFAHERDDLLDERLAGVVERMRFARKNDLHRPFGIVQNSGQPRFVPEEQRGALIGRETAREAYGEGIRIEGIFDGFQFRLGCASSLQLRVQPFAREGDKPLPPPLVRVPQFFGGDGFDAMPHALFGRLFSPARAKVALVELLHFLGNPRLEMNAVGDVRDGDFIFRHAGPQVVPHLAADLAVQPADAVAERGHAQGQRGHAEAFSRVLGIAPAECQEALAVDAEFGE